LVIELSWLPLAPVTNSSNKGADLDYGPRGPQHRENLQLRPAAN
jgi:indolepyruvate decarboxylase